MKFRVGREALGEAVAWVARALTSRPVVPVLSGLLLQADGDGLTLSCFDYEVSARMRIEADVEEAGTALVPGRLLAEITRSLPALDVEVASDADMVGLSCGSAEFTLVSLPLEEYPALPEQPAPAGTVDGGVLAVAAAQVAPAASRDDTLPMLTAVCLEIDGETLTLAATDRYRLAVREVSWVPAVPGLRAAAMVPARTLADVARTMAPGVPVTVAFGTGQASASPGAGAARSPRPADGMISFEGGNRRLTARLIGGEFIKYRSRFPEEFGSRALLPASAFTEAVRRVSLVADRASPVRLAFNPGTVVIEARTDGRARAVETVPAEFEGDERVISFSPHYLLDGLGAAAASAAPPRRAGASGDDQDESPGDPGQIRLEFTTAAKPALITWAADGGLAPGDSAGTPAFRYLVVPLRVPARA
ncbi:MAG TPA: DNA polymerase III subunit beta [Streptosporangiaceae bacterium]|nr:DNA polymerase III subunit beta [Streptosporangiaceae bacterium]